MNPQQKATNKEIWKDIPGYEGFYQVSNLGRVRSLDREVLKKDGRIYRLKGKILTPVIDTHGYETFQLGRKNHAKTHRLVAILFVPNPKPDEYNVVNHKDENPLNNQADNLEWCTQAYNMNYSHVHERNRIALSRTVGQYKNGILIKKYPSLNEVVRHGFNKRNLWKSIKYGKPTKGYTFAYI